MIIPVILSGGIGSRLWPLSRAMYPKQLLSLIGTKTMLQQTAERSPQSESLIVVCAEDHRFMVKEQLSEIGIQKPHIILEPVGRNTAPAIAMAAWLAVQKDINAHLLVMPADHLIRDQNEFLDKVRVAEKLASEDYLTTFGIKPQYAETGYGYIQATETINEDSYLVQQFVEKPDEQTALQYLKSADYYWNSGIFLFKASVYLEELKQHSSNIYHQTEKAFKSPENDGVFIRPDKQAFVECPSDSIDYAVMEKTSKAAIIPTNMGWSDIGSWDALWANSPQDNHKNVIVGDVLVEQSENCYIHSEHRLVTAVGAKNLVIVETADAVLVADKTEVQHVKKLVETLKLNERSETDLHRRVYRPWGWYESIDQHSKFQVKRICVNSGAQLSLQQHQYRAEHWVVVSGIATITKDDDEFDLKENESTYIPQGSVHRLKNNQQEILELIEIQTGTYFGEDDIVRLEDIYGREK